MGRLNSKYYRFRAECNAVNNVAPRTAVGGVFSRRYDKPKQRVGGGLYGLHKRSQEKVWMREQRHMQRARFAQSRATFIEKHGGYPVKKPVQKPFVKFRRGSVK